MATALIPPDPKSDSLVLLDGQFASGDHAIRVPDTCSATESPANSPNPPLAVFATVQVGGAIYNFSTAAGQ